MTFRFRKPRMNPYPIGSMVVSIGSPSAPVFRSVTDYIATCIYHWPNGEVGLVTGEPQDRCVPVLVNGIRGWVGMDLVKLTTETDEDVYRYTHTRGR